MASYEYIDARYGRNITIENQQPLDYSPNAFPTELRREICRVGF